jgi:prepilin-type N-terminal cleavage/methylation domain-containing protein
MESKITSTKIRAQKRQAFTLAEMMVAVAIFAIVGAALMSFFIFSIRSFASLANYAELDAANRHAMDLMTAEIREAQYVTDYQSNSLSVLDGNSTNILTYKFDTTKREMTRTSTDGTTTVLLTNCDLLNFNIYKRNPSNYTFSVNGVGGAICGIYPADGTSYSNMVKAIELTWKTAMTVSPTTMTNSENVQTARIVIRKQGILFPDS